MEAIILMGVSNIIFYCRNPIIIKYLLSMGRNILFCYLYHKNIHNRLYLLPEIYIVDMELYHNFEIIIIFVLLSLQLLYLY
jgi:hypothetical protein